MSRVTAQSSAGPVVNWQDDTLYPVLLKEYTVQPKGRPVTFQGKTKPHPYVTLDITWVLLPDLEADVWVRDFVDIKLSPSRDGKAAKARLLICCLAGRDPRHEATPWLDDESFEYGFGPDPATDTPAGRIVTGLRLQVKGTVKENEQGSYLKVERYAALTSAMAASVATTATSTTQGPQLSADGRWQWNGTAWVPAQTAPPPPPPEGVPVQGSLI